jgi:hypothetical protein
MSTEPQMVYVLQISNEEGWSLPVVHSRLRSAKKMASDIWSAQPDATGKLAWSEEDDGGTMYADPRPGVRFMIHAGLVRP